MALDSDVRNADNHLHVTFYTQTQKGHWEGKPFVRIMIPGDKTNVIEQPVREDHKRRFPRLWLNYQSQNAEGGAIPGTPLTQWNTERPGEFTDGQLAEMQVLKFQTVEQIAGASDAQIQRVGMGAAGLRERAKAYLSGKNAAENSSELAETKKQLETLQSQMAQLLAMKTTQMAEVEAPEKRKPGRPKRVLTDVHNDNAATGAAGHE